MFRHLALERLRDRLTLSQYLFVELHRHLAVMMAVILAVESGANQRYTQIVTTEV